MENKAMTNRDFLVAVVNANISDEITEFANAQIQKMDARNASRKSKGTKVQNENKEIKERIATAMEVGTTYTAAEIVALGVEGVNSTQKASALLRQLVDDGRVTSTEVKIKGKGKVKGYSLTAE